jgi:hypothetical protein
VSLSSLKNRFYQELKGIRTAIYDQLVGKGHYRRDPNAVKTAWTVAGFVVMGLGVVGAMWTGERGILMVEPSPWGPPGS